MLSGSEPGLERHIPSLCVHQYARGGFGYKHLVILSRGAGDVMRAAAQIAETCLTGPHAGFRWSLVKQPSLTAFGGLENRA